MAYRIYEQRYPWVDQSVAISPLDAATGVQLADWSSSGQHIPATVPQQHVPPYPRHYRHQGYEFVPQYWVPSAEALPVAVPANVEWSRPMVANSASQVSYRIKDDPTSSWSSGNAESRRPPTKHEPPADRLGTPQARLPSLRPGVTGGAQLVSSEGHRYPQPVFFANMNPTAVPLGSYQTVQRTQQVTYTQELVQTALVQAPGTQSDFLFSSSPASCLTYTPSPQRVRELPDSQQHLRGPASASATADLPRPAGVSSNTSVPAVDEVLSDTHTWHDKTRDPEVTLSAEQVAPPQEHHQQQQSDTTSPTSTQGGATFSEDEDPLDLILNYRPPSPLSPLSTSDSGYSSNSSSPTPPFMVPDETAILDLFDFGNESTSQVTRHPHEKRAPKRCPHCPKEYAKQRSLNFHILACHPSLATPTEAQLKQVYCALCRKFFTHPASLRTHMRAHTGERPFTCEFCYKRFADRSVWRRHRRVHTLEKPFVCEHCGLGFNQSGNMRRHMKNQHTLPH